MAVWTTGLHYTMPGGLMVLWMFIFLVCGWSVHFKIMLFSCSHSGSPMSLSRSGLSSSFSKPSLSDPSTPTPAKKYYKWILVASTESTWKGSRVNRQLIITCIRVREAWKTGLWSGALLLPGLLKSGARLGWTPKHRGPSAGWQVTAAVASIR